MFVELAAVCWTVALALLFAGGGVTTGDAYLFDRLGGFSGGVLLDEPLLPASSLTRNTRNATKPADHHDTPHQRRAFFNAAQKKEQRRAPKLHIADKDPSPQRERRAM